MSGTVALGEGIATDATGNVLLSGRFSGDIDFGGGPLVASGAWTAFAAGLDPAGAAQWGFVFGVPNNPAIILDNRMAITSNTSGRPVLTGWTDGTMDFGAGPIPTCGLFVAEVDRP